MRFVPMLVTLLLAAPALAAQAPSATIAPLSWMAGCWEQRTPTRLVQEHWMAPLGGTMIGMSRTVARESTRAWEFLRIVPASGGVSYVAAPSGQAETAFPATVLSDTLARFENPAHDFPQVIQYRRVTADSLVARIEATRAGTTRGMDIPMRRVRCDP